MRAGGRAFREAGEERDVQAEEAARQPLPGHGGADGRGRPQRAGAWVRGAGVAVKGLGGGSRPRRGSRSPAKWFAVI